MVVHWLSYARVTFQASINFVFNSQLQVHHGCYKFGIEFKGVVSNGLYIMLIENHVGVSLIRSTANPLLLS